MAFLPRAAALSLAAPALALAVLALVGCGGGEERFCDETGCYYCDGLGCRAVDDPGARSCSGDGDCDAGYLCLDGECRAQDDLCQFNYECAADRVCLDGRCAAECSVDTDCPESGQTCETGVCRCPSGGCTVDEGPEPFCTSNDECQPGHPCVGGICRTPCEEHADCLAFDVQFNYCLEGYCATTNEVTSDCALTSDCEAGQDCLDGICR